MEFIKSIFSAIVDLVIGPVLSLRHIADMGIVEIAATVTGIAARGVVIASFFCAVPALLVTLAWVWLLALPIILGAVVLLLGIVGCFFLKDLTTEDMETAMAEEDTDESDYAVAFVIVEKT